MSSDTDSSGNWSYFALGGLLVAWALLIVYFYVPWDRSLSPEELEEAARSAPTLEEREKAAISLADLGLKSRDHLGRLLASSADAEVRAVAIEGLGNLYEYDQMDQFLASMDDPSAQVRGRASYAVQKLLGLYSRFNPDGPPVERQREIEKMRKAWEVLRSNPEGLKRFQDEAQRWVAESSQAQPGN